MNWLQRLEKAKSIREVLDIVNDYLAEQPEGPWAFLPERPAEVADEDQLHRWQHQLVHEITKLKNPSANIQEACVLFLKASVRAHQIRLREDPGSSSSNDTTFSARRGWTRP